MDIKRYIIESEKQYKLRLKSLVPLDDAAMDAIEFAVARYQPLALSRPKKTILQMHPMDFANVLAAEVYIVDMTFALPVSASVMREDIRKVLRAPETSVVVQTPNDALAIEGERTLAANALEATRKAKNLRFAALLDTGIGYPEATVTDADDLAGDTYNASLLSYLDAVRKERADRVVKAANAPFIWLDIPDRTSQEPVQDGSDFNQDIKGAPKVKPGGPINPSLAGRSIMGAIDDRIQVSRLYKDNDGNRVKASVMMDKLP
jgi:hypothetical protein